MKIIFLRVSTEQQDFNQQLNPIIKEFNLKEYKLISEKQSAFKEEKENKRQGLQELKKEIATRKYKQLYVFALDRLFRNRLKQKEFLEYLKIYNVELYSYSQKFLNDIWKIPKPYNEMFYNFLIDVFSNMAEEESKIKSLRIKKAYDSGNHNKWGRQKLNVDEEKIKLRYKELNSIRKVAKEFKISVGSVQKITSQLKPKNNE